jgi:antitoxin MazE
METILRTRVVKIGNSQGIRIPKPLLERFNLSDEIELLVKDGLLVIRPAFHPRARWEEQCRLMAKRGDDRLLDPEVISTSTWDEDEWEW